MHTMPVPALPLRCVGELKGHDGPVMVVRFNANGNYCLTGGRDKMLKLWNPHTQLLIKTYKGHSQEVTGCDASQDNRVLVSCSSDKTSFIWDVATGSSIRKLRGHRAQANSVSLNAEATVLASASYDACVLLWDLRSRSYEPIQTLNEAKDSVASVQIRDSEIITGSVDGRARVYDLRAGRMRTDFIGEPVTSASLSNDGNCLLLSSLDNTIRLLDKDSGELLKDYLGHKNSAYKVDSTLAYNDAYVVSGSEDGLIYFWDLVDGKVLGQAKGHAATVCSVSHHPSSAALLSASVDGCVKVWKTTLM